MTSNKFSKENSVLLKDTFSGKWLFFTDPHDTIVSSYPDSVIDCLEQISTYNRNGYYAAGFISYEAAPAFDKALKVRSLQDFPLLWFGIYKEVHKIDTLEIPSSIENINLSPTLSKNDFHKNIHAIKNYIKKGQTYQVNYTYQLKGNIASEPLNVFGYLYNKQAAEYAAFINSSDFSICSVSPELFFKKNEDYISTKPMKGTIKRGYFFEHDLEQKSLLTRSKKDRAENIMIVDMIRNDLGKIAECGSVKVNSIYDIEKLPTVWQMTSTVSAQTKATIVDIFKALFPCASITGAPKPKTMQIISELENSPRGVYTGSIGYISPRNTAQFNVAIRTLTINKESKESLYGIGGGIVWDSDATSEYDESILKSKVLTQKRPQFDLLETMLWTPENGIYLLDYHLARLEKSTRYFEFKFDKKHVLNELTATVDSLEKTDYKIRVLLSKSGSVKIESFLLDKKNASPVKLALAPNPIDSTNPFFYNKTTFREIYDIPLKALKKADQVLMWNEKEEITETTFCNFVAKIDNKFYTPSVSSGLLNGTFRQHLIDQKELNERIIKKSELKEIEKIYLINSVQKWQKAILL